MSLGWPFWWFDDGPVAVVTPPICVAITAGPEVFARVCCPSLMTPTTLAGPDLLTLCKVFRSDAVGCDLTAEAC